LLGLREIIADLHQNFSKNDYLLRKKKESGSIVRNSSIVCVDGFFEKSYWTFLSESI
jgi:hypothetical protein